MGLVLSEPWDDDFNLRHIVNAPKSHRRHTFSCQGRYETTPMTFFSTYTSTWTPSNKQYHSQTYSSISPRQTTSNLNHQPSSNLPQQLFTNIIASESKTTSYDDATIPLWGSVVGDNDCRA